jgi:exonuclease III
VNFVSNPTPDLCVVYLKVWNVRSLHRACALVAVDRELAKYNLDLLGVQEVRWDREGTVRAGDYNVFFFFCGKGNEYYPLGTGLFVHHRIVSAVKREDFVRDGVSCTVLRGRWGNIIVLNARAPSKENHWEDPGVDGRIILRWNLQEVGYGVCGYRLDRAGSG